MHQYSHKYIPRDSLHLCQHSILPALTSCFSHTEEHADQLWVNISLCTLSLSLSLTLSLSLSLCLCWFLLSSPPSLPLPLPLHLWRIWLKSQSVACRLCIYSAVTHFLSTGDGFKEKGGVSVCVCVCVCVRDGRESHRQTGRARQRDRWGDGPTADRQTPVKTSTHRQINKQWKERKMSVKH